MFDRLHDARVRRAAFEWLAEQVERIGDVIPRDILAEGFIFDDERIPLLSPQGIFKPRILDVPLSLSTTPRGPYDDAFGADGLLRYRYRGTNPQHRDNIGVRTAMEYQLPLIYFQGVIPGKYIAAWPVFVVGDNPSGLVFMIAVDDADHLGLDIDKTSVTGSVQDSFEEGRRLYVTSVTRQRLHQHSFRERVLEAYQRQCSFCRLRHEELLDAAHIIGDREPGGDPVVNNGLSLCKIHHAAFDRHFIGLRPDYILEVRSDLMEEEDGPTLVHAIQSLHESRIILPQRREQWPSEERLTRRYERFLMNQKAS